MDLICKRPSSNTNQKQIPMDAPHKPNSFSIDLLFVSILFSTNFNPPSSIPLVLFNYLLTSLKLQHWNSMPSHPDNNYRPLGYKTDISSNTIYGLCGHFHSWYGWLIHARTMSVSSIGNETRRVWTIPLAVSIFKESRKLVGLIEKIYQFGFRHGQSFGEGPGRFVAG